MAEWWRLPAGRPPDLEPWLRQRPGWRLLAVCAVNQPLVAALLPASAGAGIDLACMPADEPAALVLRRLADLGRPPLATDRDDLAGYPDRWWPAEPMGPLPAGLPPATANGALLLPRSGSTGPGGLHPLPWTAVREAAMTSAAACGLEPGATWLCPLPLAHAGGALLVLRALAAGTDLVLCRRFDAALVDGLLDRERVAGMSLVPTMLARLLAAHGDRPFPPTLRHLIVGGAGLDDRLRRAAADRGCPPRLCYGLTETAAMATLQTPAEAAAGTGSGRPLPGREVRIAGADSIEVRAPATGGRWLATGDHGRLLPDGQLSVTGRDATRIVSGGETVAAEMVEEVLRAHPAIAEVAVCGLPDAVWGEVVVALVVATVAEQAPDLTAWLREHLPPAARPKRIRWTAALPLTGTGKVDRSAVRASWDG